MNGDGWVDEVASQAPQSRERPLFVRQNQLWANPWYEAKNLRNDVQREFNFEAYELLLRGREQALALTRGKEVGRRVTIMSQSDDVKTEVLNALYWDLAVPRHRVIVEVENGWVTMSGMVDRPYQRKCAESDARRVPGVTGVTNQIRLAAGAGGAGFVGVYQRAPRGRLFPPMQTRGTKAEQRASGEPASRSALTSKGLARATVGSCVGKSRAGTVTLPCDWQLWREANVRSP